MRSRHFLRLLAAAWVLWIAGQVYAHEVRPGYLELREIAPATFSVLWKVPMRGGARLKLEPRLPDTCRQKTPPSSRVAAGATIQRWSLACDGKLSGGVIAIDGLEHTLTDVLVRIERHDGSVHTERLTPGKPSFEVTGAASVWQIASTYLGLGVEHILLGIDHLLFVLALLIIVKAWRTLVATITAFTVAHSITLAAATLGYVHAPQQPVEAVIALSILFLATEIMHTRQGHPGLAQRRPWLVAFVFGLLHGFGFAGALAEVGLPEQAIPLALLFFNVGVEVGQLLFVAAMIALYRIWVRLEVRPMRWAQALPVYAIGSITAYWTIERVAGFWP
jgi:hydrogenase/urease accessory protein HupE